jgi:EthD domain
VAEGVSATGRVKLVILPRTRTGLDRAELRHHLETVHGPMVVNDPEVSGRFTSYVHHYVEDRAELQGDLLLQDRDAVTIIRIPTMAELGLSKSNDGYRNTIGPDEDNFREIEGSVALFAEEYEVAPGADDAPRKLFVFRRAKPDDMENWASKVRELVSHNGLHGAIVNIANAIDGDFSYPQFDEIGLPGTVDVASLIASVNQATFAHFGAVDTKMVFTEAVRFI